MKAKAKVWRTKKAKARSKRTARSRKDRLSSRISTQREAKSSRPKKPAAKSAKMEESLIEVCDGDEAADAIDESLIDEESEREKPCPA